MSAPAGSTVPTYPHLGALFTAAGSGVTAFAAADTALPDSVKGAIAGVGVALTTAGLFLLGRSTAAGA